MEQLSEMDESTCVTFLWTVQIFGMQNIQSCETGNRQYKLSKELESNVEQNTNTKYHLLRYIKV